MLFFISLKAIKTKNVRGAALFIFKAELLFLYTCNGIDIVNNESGTVGTVVMKIMRTVAVSRANYVTQVNDERGNVYRRLKVGNSGETLKAMSERARKEMSNSVIG